MDENTVPAENVEAVEDNSLDTSPVDETTTSSEQVQETDEVTSSAEESTDETESGSQERKPTRAERRIRDLTKRLQQYEQEPNQLGQQLRQSPQPLFEDGREYTAAELNQRVVQTANDIAAIQTQAQISQLKAETNLDKDIEIIPTKFPELDDTSEDFVPELVETIEEEFKAKAYRNGVLDPSVRLADIAERHVKAARAVAQKSAAKMKNAVASTADTAAVKPGSGVKQEKSLDQMSASEIEDMMRKQGKYVKA